MMDRPLPVARRSLYRIVRIPCNTVTGTTLDTRLLLALGLGWLAHAAEALPNTVTLCDGK